MKKSPQNVKEAIKSSKSASFTIKNDKSQALKTIVRFAQANGYKVDSIDDAQYTVVLSDSVSATTWGFFYMIQIDDYSAGNNKISVGVKSKVTQGGPIVDRNLEKCVNGFKATFYAES